MFQALVTKPDCNPANYTIPDFEPVVGCREDQVVLDFCHSMFGGCYDVCIPGHGVVGLCIDGCIPLCGCADGYAEDSNGNCFRK